MEKTVNQPVLKTSVVNFGNGIYAIDQQMVRAFLIVGTNKALLLDTGAIRIDINKYIEEITDLPLEVVLTHRDGDHIANLEDFSSCYVQERDMIPLLTKESLKNTNFNKLQEGQIFDLGGRVLKVIYTPGHTHGSICLLDEENKILFSGDTVSYGPIFMFGERRDMKEFITSLKKLRVMRDAGLFSTVYCCHNECPLGASVVDEVLACAEGVEDKSITPIPVNIPIPFSKNPLLCKYGKCGILIERNGGRKMYDEK